MPLKSPYVSKRGRLKEMRYEVNSLYYQHSEHSELVFLRERGPLPFTVLNVVFKAHKLVDMYANWTYRSGNRYTLPAYEYGVTLEPNNFQMPAYHRLDIGIDFRAKTRKKGDDYTVTFGVYNLYGRRNPIYLQRSQDVYQRPTLKLTSVFPVLPSVRYTRWF